MTDTLSLLGKLVVGDPERDAIHIAVVPMVAGEKLAPGAKVRWELKVAIEAKTGENYIGIVDPYLDSHVRKGEKFWLFLNPGSITSLIHKWTHPVIDRISDFAASPRTADALATLKEFCNEHGIRLDDFIKGCVSGEGYCFDNDSSQEAVTPQIWDAVQAVSGVTLDNDHRESTYFRCAC